MANINFIHFNGSEAEWSQRMGSGVYANDIVFAKIWDTSAEPPACRYVIYSGKDANGAGYVYDVPDIDSFHDIEDLVNISPEGNFTNDDFKQAIELYLSGESQAISDLNANVSTGSDITIAQNVGYLKAGQVIPTGTNVEDLIRLIFTKVLGLSGATAPTGSVSGISATTKEAGETFSCTVTASFGDGSWTNEDGWKRDGKTYQPYGCNAESFRFSGMVTTEATAARTADVTDYVIVYGSGNYVECAETYTGSANVPVNQNGEALREGTVNNTTTYKPQPAGIVRPKSGVIKGDYYYWIGYTTKCDVESQMTRSDIEDTAVFTVVSRGFVGNGVTVSTEFLTPQNSYVTVIVPYRVQLQSVTDTFGNEVRSNFTESESDGGMIGKDWRMKYRVYQEKADSEAGLKRKNVKIG